jgi:hypothetical protein
VVIVVSVAFALLAKTLKRIGNIINPILVVLPKVIVSLSSPDVIPLL